MFEDAKKVFEARIEELRQSVKDSLVDLNVAWKDAEVAREYVKLVEFRNRVADQMTDEFGDKTYASFEVKLWCDLFEYVNSERSTLDKSNLAKAIMGMIQVVGVVVVVASICL